MQTKITVYKYKDISVPGGADYTKPADIEKYEVDAWCVDGKEGILAFFFAKNLFHIAAGDDGHWWLIYSCDVNWFTGIKKAFKNMVVHR